MGEVWLARDEALARRLALKLLPDELTRDPLHVGRFEQEARAASALNHPNVCHIYALGTTDGGQRYIAMELVEGQTLRARLHGARLSIREALNIANQIAAALVAAHTLGIVHRDIKPENVMLRPDGIVKVLDFGLAKLAPTAASLADSNPTQTLLHTDAGTVVGTVTYMSPEQARRQDVDARTDIWSLGVVLYELVAGRTPFAGPSSSDVIAAILDRTPDALARFQPDVTQELQRIVTKALRKDRAHRYQTIRDLQIDLQALLDDLAPAGSHAEPALPMNGVTRWFWYLSQQKLGNIRSPQRWSFLKATPGLQSMALGAPWGKLSEAETLRSAWIQEVSQVEREIRAQFSVIRVGQIQTGDTPVFVEFQGEAGRLILRESYKDANEGDSVFILVGIENRTGIVLLGSGSNVVGANAARPRLTDPSGDPVGALLDLVDRHAGVSGYTRVGIAAHRVGVRGLEQCALFSFAAALHESEQRGFPAYVRALPVFSGQVAANSVDEIKGFKYAGLTFPNVDRVVIGSPIYVEQIDDPAASQALRSSSVG